MSQSISKLVAMLVASGVPDDEWVPLAVKVFNATRAKLLAAIPDKLEEYAHEILISEPPHSEKLSTQVSAKRKAPQFKGSLPTIHEALKSNEATALQGSLHPSSDVKLVRVHGEVSAFASGSQKPIIAADLKVEKSSYPVIAKDHGTDDPRKHSPLMLKSLGKGFQKWASHSFSNHLIIEWVVHCRPRK